MGPIEKVIRFKTQNMILPLFVNQEDINKENPI